MKVAQRVGGVLVLAFAAMTSAAPANAQDYGAAPMLGMSWHGFYVGGNVGGALDGSSLSIYDLSGAQLRITDNTDDQFVGGVLPATICRAHTSSTASRAMPTSATTSASSAVSAPASDGQVNASSSMARRASASSMPTPSSPSTRPSCRRRARAPTSARLALSSVAVSTSKLCRD